MLNFFELNILPESEQLEYLLNGTEPKSTLAEVYLCPSYIDDDGILQNCECGGKCNV